MVATLPPPKVYTRKYVVAVNSSYQAAQEALQIGEREADSLSPSYQSVWRWSCTSGFPHARFLYRFGVSGSRATESGYEKRGFLFGAT
jgi:hypothetical protein